MKNFFKVKINYFSNFTPKLNNKSTLKKKKIFLKNFFFSMILLKNTKYFDTVSIFIKPIQFRKIVLLRAPYRYKLARLHLTVNRYNIVLIFSINLKNNFDINTICLKKKFFSNFFSSMGSTFVHQNKHNVTFVISQNDNFFLKKF